MYPDYNNPPYGTPAYFEKQDRLKNAHKSPDPILAQQQIQATQDAYAAANPVLNTNPLPTTAIPPGTQVNPRQGPTPGQRFMDGAKGILGQMTSDSNDRMMGQYGQQPMQHHQQHQHHIDVGDYIDFSYQFTFRFSSLHKP